MFGKLLKQLANVKHSRRSYLFVLLSLVIFLILVCLAPNRLVLRRSTEINIEVANVHNVDSVSRKVVAELKKQLNIETLAKSLNAISGAVNLESPLLADPDIGTIRENLLAGALTIESRVVEPVQNKLMLALKLRGEGTNDEKVFLSTLANTIRKTLLTEKHTEEIANQVKTIRRKLRESEALSSKSRKSIEKMFETFAENQRQILVFNQANRSGTAANLVNWEMKNLVDQKDLAYEKFRNNIDLQFKDKDKIQAGLMLRIEYLDQQIKRLREQQNSNESFAEKDNEVERASFVDSEKVYPVGMVEQLGELKREIGSVVQQLAFAEEIFRDGLAATQDLDELLSAGRGEVSVAVPVQNEIGDVSAVKIWIYLAFSTCLSGFVVMRINAKAFGAFFNDSATAERLLQAPVIGKVSLPANSSGKKSNLNKTSKWITLTIKGCEIVVLAAFVIFLIGFLVENDFSIQWFTDPIRSIQNSFK
ncbi:MAG: hypothetical protein VX438_06230 [Planctomycetota bacterium]|nr:hypothetical protein [Planctomycetota bacterium]